LKCNVVIVPIGKPSDEVLDAVGYVSQIFATLKGPNLLPGVPFVGPAIQQGIRNPAAPANFSTEISTKEEVSGQLLVHAVHPVHIVHSVLAIQEIRWILPDFNPLWDGCEDRPKDSAVREQSPGRHCAHTLASF
jgi:hypothetical protein